MLPQPAVPATSPAGTTNFVTNTTGQNVQIVFYLLWDWQDGRLNEGWR